jgi:hypothetical protein
VFGAAAAIYMMWCLPSLPTGRIGRLVVLNSSLPPHPLLTELGVAHALLVAIWMAGVAIVGRWMPVSTDIHNLLGLLYSHMNQAASLRHACL